MRDFTVSVLPGMVGDAVGLRLEVTGATSVGRSGDGRLSVALLGDNLRTADAFAIAAGRTDKPIFPDWTELGPAGCLIIDHHSGKVDVRVPPIAQHRVYFAVEDRSLRLASRPASLLPTGAARARLRPAALFQYVYFHMVPGPTCIYESVAKLPGGHALHWAAGRTAITRYWRPDFQDEANFTFEETAGQLWCDLRRALAEAVSAGSAPGVFLSGGLDSSTVAGLAAELRPGIPTITMGFDARGYDEMEFARIASKRFRTRALEYYITPDDVLETLPAIAAAYPEPFGNSSAAAVYHCARIARENGIDLLLAGDGGDELFGGNERYATQLLFERYALVPPWARTKLIEPVITVAARTAGFRLVRRAASYIEQANQPLPDRLQSYNFLHRHAPHDVFTPEFLAQVDASESLQLLREQFDVPTTRDVVNRMLFLDWRFTLEDNDLVKVGEMCRLNDVRVAFPLLHPKLLELSLLLPGHWKVRRSHLRWFYRQAMQGFLPPEIIRKRKHGFGLPFGIWTRSHRGLAQLCDDALHSLGARGYFRPQFLDNALKMHREGHAAYYGELIWILLVLELWLRRHAPEGL